MHAPSQRTTSVLAFAAALAIAMLVSPRPAAANELATAVGTIAISEAPAGQRSPACGELVVEARDALDDHLIGRTQPTPDAAGVCRYALSVPAQSAVWLRLRPALVASERIVGGSGSASPAHASTANSRSVALRFTVIGPTTFFFAPGEQKTVPLSY